jgi:hypothetical protein
MPYARWKFDIVRALLWILKFHWEQDVAFNPRCESIKQWIETVRKMAKAVKCKWTGISDFAVPAYPIFVWTETNEYLRSMAQSIPAKPPTIQEAKQALSSWIHSVQS